MATTKITVDPAEVIAIATQMEKDNQTLKTLLDDCQKAINELSGSWTGEAAQATYDAVNGFANQFNQSYYDQLEAYVKFLRDNVSEQYTEVENTNTKLADQFK